jgi:AcrR family transcriptional regulator
MSDLPLPSPRRSRRGAEPSLTAEDWVAAGTAILAEENVRGVQIPALCARLKVTKGSFYWHFPGLADLLRRLLEAWRRRATLDVIGRLTRSTAGMSATLRALLALPRRARSRDAAALESSIRDWARRDGTAARAVAEVDQVRLAFFEQIFRAGGFAGAEATVRAYIAYSAMMGDSILHRTLRPSAPDDAYLDMVVALLSARPGER